MREGEKERTMAERGQGINAEDLKSDIYVVGERAIHLSLGSPISTWESIERRLFVSQSAEQADNGAPSRH